VNYLAFGFIRLMRNLTD